MSLFQNWFFDFFIVESFHFWISVILRIRSLLKSLFYSLILITSKNIAYFAIFCKNFHDQYRLMRQIYFIILKISHS